MDFRQSLFLNTFLAGRTGQGGAARRAGVEFRQAALHAHEQRDRRPKVFPVIAACQPAGPSPDEQSIGMIKEREADMATAPRSSDRATRGPHPSWHARPSAKRQPSTPTTLVMTEGQQGRSCGEPMFHPLHYILFKRSSGNSPDGSSVLHLRPRQVLVHLVEKNLHVILWKSEHLFRRQS